MEKTEKPVNNENKTYDDAKIKIVNNSNVFKWLYKNTGKFIPVIILLAVSGAVISFLEVRFAYSSKNLLDVATGAQDGKIFDSLKVLSFLLICQLFFNVVYTFIELKLQFSIKYSVQRNLFKKMLGKQVKHLGKIHTGELSNRLNSDTQIVTNGVISIFPNIIALVSQIVFSLIALYKMDKTFALICVVLGAFTMLISRLYSRKMKTLHKKHQLADGKIRSFMQECLQNIQAIKVFMCESKVAKKSKIYQKEAYKIAFRRNVISILAKVLFFLAMTVSYYFALGWCAYKISIGVMTVGSLAAILQLVGQLQTPFANLSSLVPQYYASMASAERIMEIEELSDDIEHNKYNECTPLIKDFESLEFKDVEFSYGNDYVIMNASFSVNRGDMALISGISGIGKSTLFKLMLGVENPQKGEILLKSKDKTLRIDKNTRCVFTYVPQGNLMLSGTIRDNVVFFSDYNNEERIIKCLKDACLWDYISTLPDGLDTKLGENGSGISEGQRQRLAIARALYRDAPVILLDEATSALDEETETHVLNNIAAIEGKTCIVISHKQGANRLCSTQITIEDGYVKNVQLV